jgi:hypothetical protein
MAMEAAEAAARPPPVRDALFAAPPPSAPRPAAVAAAPVAVPSAATAAPQDFDFRPPQGAKEEKLELDLKPWTPAASPAAPPRVRERPSGPGVRAPNAPRPYAPLEVKVVAPPPRSFSRPLTALAAAAIGVAIASWVMAESGETTEVADPEPQGPAALITAPTIATPEPEPPPPAPVVLGKLRFSGLPADARVTVDGVVILEPHKERPIPIGSHQVRVEAKGREDFTASIEIAADKLKVVRVAMKKVKKKR